MPVTLTLIKALHPAGYGKSFPSLQTNDFLEGRKDRWKEERGEGERRLISTRYQQGNLPDAY